MATKTAEVTLRRWWSNSRAAWASATAPERAAFVLTLLIVVAGLAFRARGYVFSTPALWLDEANWALHLLEGRYGDDNLRPLGFMALTRVLVELFSPSESVLRAIPWFSGVATVLLAPFLARRLYAAPGARLLFVAVLALHPAAIDLSKEFKPYSTSLFLHVALMIATLRYVERGRGRDLVPPLALAVAGTFFAQDLVFAYPGVFALLVWNAYRRRKLHLAPVIGCGALVNVALGAQYVLVWSRIPERESTYWGNKYNVFHTEDGSYLGWSLSRFADILRFPGERRRFWESDFLSTDVLEALRSADVFAWSFACVLGLAVLVKERRLTLSLLVVLPLLVLWIFNALDVWPLGAFRTNLFALCYAGAMAAVPVDGDWSRDTRWLALAPTLLLVLAPLVAFESDWHARKRLFTNEGYLPRALREVEALNRERPRVRRSALLFSYGACSQWEYYSRIHPNAAATRRAVEPSFDARCVPRRDLVKIIRAETRTGARVWTINRKWTLDDWLPDRARRSLEVLGERRLGILRIAGFEKRWPGRLGKRWRARFPQFGDAATDDAAGARSP